MHVPWYYVERPDTAAANLAWPPHQCTVELWYSGPNATQFHCSASSLWSLARCSVVAHSWKRSFSTTLTYVIVAGCVGTSAQSATSWLGTTVLCFDSTRIVGLDANDLP